MFNNPDHLIAETNQAGQMLKEYGYLGDQLLSMVKPGETVYYFHIDHLSTPHVLTDDTGTIAWKAVYTPFGEAVASIQTVDNPFRFPGQYSDQQTRLLTITSNTTTRRQGDISLLIPLAWRTG